MLNNYFCKYNLLHDRPTDNGYVSGNGVYYSALLFELGGYDLVEYFTLRSVIRSNFILDKTKTIRYPDNHKPDSHDNILGHLYFNTLEVNNLKEANWYINGYKDEYSWWQFILTAWLYREEMQADRNFWWENDLHEIGKLANKLHMWVRYFASKSIIYYVPFMIHVLFSYLKPNFTDGVRETNNVSAKIQCAFMLKSINSRYLILLFNIKELCDIYFDNENHPVRKQLK